MRKLFIISLFVLSPTARGQHVPVYSQYLMNGLAINPAYAGSRDVLSCAVMYRQQWIGFEGAPKTLNLAVHWPFPNKALAAGLLVTNESIGVSNTIGCFGNYAYRIRARKGFLAFGLKAGFEMLRENSSMITTETSEDEVFNSNSSGYFLPNFGLGIYYYNTSFFAGVSVPTILSYRKKNTADGYDAYNNAKNYNYLFSAGALFHINETFKIKPSTLLRYRYNSPFQYDLNCNFILLKGGILCLGASYRASEAMVGLLEIQLNTQVRVGYSYDYSVGSLGKYNNGTHEIMVRYEFRYIVNAINPKYF